MRKFVPLHTHTGLGSPYDGLDYPDDFVKEAVSKGLDTIAITEHGNMNSLGEFVLSLRENEGVKGIYGVEGYYIPSVDEWQENYDLLEQLKKQKKIKRGKKIINTNTDDITEGSYSEVSCWIAKHEGIDIDNIVLKLKERYHILLLAQNEEGLRNLFSLVSYSHMNSDKRYFYKFPRIDRELLKKYNKGIIASSACLSGIIGGTYWNYKDSVEDIQSKIDEVNADLKGIFGDRWYNEIQFNSVEGQHEINEHVIKSANKLDIPIIATVDTHYTKKELWKSRYLYNKMRFMRGKDVKQIEIPDTVEAVGYELHLKDGDEVYDSYLKYDPTLDSEIVEKAIKETCRLADRIEKFYPDNSIRLPGFLLEGKADADRELKRLSLEGFKSLGLMGNREYEERLRHEIDVILYRGFSKYFLTMMEIVKEAKKHMVNGVSRGSAGGSLVSYCLGITDIDPIAMNLSFSRFMTRGASDWPDIDFDVSSPAEFKEILKGVWGEERIVNVSNWNKLSFKSLIKDLAKFYGIDFQEVNAATRNMISEIVEKVRGLEEYKDDIISENSFGVELRHLQYSKSYNKFISKYPQIKESLETLLGQVRDVGAHAGGVIIGDDLPSNMPLIRKKDKLQTPWPESGTHRVLEDMGWVKFDILGISTLKMVENTIELILKRKGNKNPTFEDIRRYYDSRLLPSVLNLEDKEVWKNVFHDGKMIGIFQFTSPGMQSFCQKVKPNSIIELAAVTSIYRPGPMGANVHIDYANTASGKKSPVYYSSEHREVTEMTHGYLVFQEQLAELVHKLGNGISMDEGHKIRKLLTSKGEKQKQQAQEYREKFLDGCFGHGINKSLANKLWENVIKFSGYGFNKCIWEGEYVDIYEGDGSYIDSVEIKDVEPGVFVKSRDEATGEEIFVEVVNNFDSGYKDLVEVELETGEKIICTIDHKFRTECGRMLPLKKIIEMDLSISVSAEKNTHKR